MGTAHLPAYTEVAPAEVDADAWFAALDGRLLAIGPDTCIVRVMGIHAEGAYLWIQLACSDRPERSVVLQVSATHTTTDVLAVLGSRTPCDSALEIIRVPPTA